MTLLQATANPFTPDVAGPAALSASVSVARTTTTATDRPPAARRRGRRGIGVLLSARGRRSHEQDGRWRAADCASIPRSDGCVRFATYPQRLAHVTRMGYRSLPLGRPA